MNWRASMSWQTAQKKSALNKKIRHFFEVRGVVEVETPLLSQGTVTDIHLDGFKTKYDFSAGDELALYLQTSPEFCMKRLLASGYGDIYQLCKAFRDEPYGKQHNPEFSILEWYRKGYNLIDLMREVEELLVETLACEKAFYISYQDVFIESTSIDPLAADITLLKNFLKKHGKLDQWLLETDSTDTLLQFIFSEFIEGNIGVVSPCFVYNFPASQASLAKLSQGDVRVAERFECYFKGIELANGFNELTDVELQQERFEADNRGRRSLGFKEKPIDSRFINALNHGLPQCSGVALGVDRLMMLLGDYNDITDVLTFPIIDA